MIAWALVPAYNEVERVASTVKAIGALPQVEGVLVVDDGSSDATARAASTAGARVLTLGHNLGKGAALDRGLAWLAENAPGATLLLLDADLGDTAAQAGALLEPLVRGEADMAIARFPRATGKAGFGLVKGLARWGIRKLGSKSFSAEAPLSGQRALTPTAVEACVPFARGYGVEVALTVRALRAGLRVVEVETTMAHAATGRDLAGFVHRGRQFAHVARALVSLALERPRG